MDPNQALVRHIETAIAADLDERASALREISEDATVLVDVARELLRGGKRLRPAFCYWGWRAVADETSPDVLPHLGTGDGELEAILAIAVALEYFHAAALVHDDIIDRSDTRRGIPSAHRRFEQLYPRAAAAPDVAHFGESSAILLGDLLLSWSNELFAGAMARPFAAERKELARRRIAVMSSEVMVGQYLDVFAEGAWPLRGADEALSESLTVLRFKSAKYSVEAPLLIGATIAGARVGQLDALSRYGLALGEAFQLRDDVLGVFGDPETTGKPAGDDIREGKRTYLVLLTRSRLPHGMRSVLDEMLGDRDADDDQIELARTLAGETGAIDAVEEMIAARCANARAALAEGDFPATAAEELGRLVDAAAYRAK